VTNARAYVATLILFLAIDALWLGVVARAFYVAQLGPVLREQPNLFAAGLFYLGYAGAIVYFAIAPAIARSDWTVAARNGAILGLVAYGTYELSNFATLPGWPLTIVPVDMAWGMVATGASAAGGFFIARRLS